MRILPFAGALLMAAALFTAAALCPAAGATASQSPASRVQLLNNAFRIAAHEYGYVPIRLANWPSTVDCSFHVLSGAPVRVELVSGHDLRAFVRGKPYEFLIRLSPRAESRFEQPVPERGDYDLLLINDGSQDSSVQIEAAAQFAREPDVATYLSPQRRMTVIAVSLLVFLGILIPSAWGLIGAMRRGAGGEKS